MSPVRRWSRVALIPMLLASLACAQLTGPASAAVPQVSAAAADPGPSEIEAAEQRVIELINERRDHKGLRALRPDPRVAKVARARSQDMIDRSYFSHEDPDGKFARQYLTRAHIRFTRVSEIIAWDRGSDLQAAGRGSGPDVDGLAGPSPRDPEHDPQLPRCGRGHRRAAPSSGRSSPSPDATAPIPPRGSCRWSWQVTRRPCAGPATIRGWWWAPRASGTTTWRADIQAALGRRCATTRAGSSTTSAAQDGTEFRVRARDKAGNTGPWSTPVTATTS